MSEKTASVMWTGAGRDGAGKVSTESGALMDHPYGFASRFGQGTSGTGIPSRRSSSERMAGASGRVDGAALRSGVAAPAAEGGGKARDEGAGEQRDDPPQRTVGQCLAPARPLRGPPAPRREAGWRPHRAWTASRRSSPSSRPRRRAPFPSMPRRCRGSCRRRQDPVRGHRHRWKGTGPSVLQQLSSEPGAGNTGLSC